LQARRLYEEVLERDERSASQSDSFFARQDLIVALERLADLAQREGDVVGAREYLERGVALSRHLTDITPDDRQSHGYLAWALERLGLLELDEGDIADAERYVREAAREHDLAAPDSEQRPSLASLQLLGQLAKVKGEIPEAKRRYRTYEERSRRRAEAAPEDVDAQVKWALSLERLGDVAMSQRQWTQADELYNQELAIVERLAALLPDDVAAQRRLSLALEKLGDCALKNGEIARARPRFERSMAIRQRLRELLPVDLEALRDLGLAHERLGMLIDQPVAGSLKHLEEAIAIYTQLRELLPGNEEAARTLALGHFALAQALASIPDRSLEAHGQAARAHELLSDLRDAGQVLVPDAKRVLAILDTQFGGSGRWTHPVAREDEQKYGELNFLGSAGTQAVSAGDLGTAHERFRKSLDLALEIGHPPSLARAYGSLGDVAGKLGDTREAVELLETAIAIARENDLPAEQGTALNRLAELYANLGDHERSLAAYGACVAVARRAGDHRSLAMGLANLGVSYFQVGNMPTGLSHFQVAARIFKAQGMDHELAKAYRYIGACFVNVRDPDRAMAAYSEHIAICQQLGDTASAALSMVNLSTLLYMTGAHDDAIETGQQACKLLQELGMAQSAEVCSQVAAWKNEPPRGSQKRRRTRE
jgi:tetratricopeptide (TPR) repeat protein